MNFYLNSTKHASLYASALSFHPLSVLQIAKIYKKALKEKGIDKLLDDARESNRENDLENLRRGCKLCLYWFPRVSQ